MKLLLAAIFLLNIDKQEIKWNQHSFCCMSLHYFKSYHTNTKIENLHQGLNVAALRYDAYSHESFWNGNTHAILMNFARLLSAHAILCFLMSCCPCWWPKWTLPIDILLSHNYLINSLLKFNFPPELCSQQKMKEKTILASCYLWLFCKNKFKKEEMSCIGIRCFHIYISWWRLSLCSSEA